jgi:hypothetical protein
VQFVDEGQALALSVFVERKLEFSRPPGVIRRRRVEVLAEMLIEDDSLARQAIEIRRFDPVIAAATEKPGMETVETDNERAALGRGFRTAASWFTDQQRNVSACGTNWGDCNKSLVRFREMRGRTWSILGDRRKTKPRINTARRSATTKLQVKKRKNTNLS